MPREADVKLAEHLVASIDRADQLLRSWLRAGANRAAALIAGAIQLSRRRWIRRTGVAILAVLVLFGAFGFIGVPMILRRVMVNQVAASVNRPISVGKIRFNPYRLKLEIDKLHVGERGSAAPFVDIGHLLVKVSWTSLYQLAPVVKQVELGQPSIHLVRTGPTAFNFSDLIAPKPGEAEQAKPAAGGKPMRFAFSNIVLRDGNVALDDRFLGEHHAIEHIQIGVPFIANLPADTDIFVQPLLQMVVDGSALLITGKAKPFATPPESVLDLDLHRLSIPRYLAYAPHKLPVKVPDGSLSSALKIRFVNATPRPKVSIAGEIAIDKLDIREDSGSPVLQLAHLAIAIADAEPLENVAHLKRIFIDGLNPHLVREPDGTMNFVRLVVASAAPPSQSSSPPAAPTPHPPQPTMQMTASNSQPELPDVTLDAFEMTNSTVNVTDHTGPEPADLALQAIRVHVNHLATSAQAPPADYDVAANLSGGGAISIKGTIDVPKSQVTTDFGLDQLDLPSLQKFAGSILAAEIDGGKLSLHANLKSALANNQFNVHIAPATLAIDNFDVRAPKEHESAVGWKNVTVALGDADLASRSATVKEVRTDGVHLFVSRAANGQLSLASLLRGPAVSAKPAEREAREPASRTSREHRRARRAVHERSTHERREARGAPAAQALPAPAPPAAQPWRFAVETIAIENTQAKVRDESGPKPVEMLIAPVNLEVKDVSSDFSKPFTIALAGTVNEKGTFEVKGTTALDPLKADLKVDTKRLDLSPLDPYLSEQLNASIESAALTMNAAVGVERKREEIRASYRGDVTLGGFRMLDKLTGDTFVRWNSFSVNRIDALYGNGKPKVKIGDIALSDFYARIILNRNGKLNLTDVMKAPEQAPTSLTREHPTEPAPGAAPTPVPAAAPSPAAEASPAASPPPQPKPLPADIEVGRITLQGGGINYTDDFIKPNYTANLTEIAGKVGAFGTSSTEPAEVSLQGEINQSAPIDISGDVNPLAPMASLDIKADAKGIELTGFTPYTTKYTGYPITKGTLTVDVHYQLQNQSLTADNHIFIDQLTFGDHVESPTATNLPIRLAVALLKNPAGQIDLRVPISGSLNDPQFSVSSVILHAFGNLIIKAATSPFSLIASTFGAMTGGGSQELRYIEFAPGYDTLTPDSKQRLDTIIKALQARPGLKLDITGRVDPKVDADGYREAMVADQVRIQKRRALGRSAGIDPAADAIGPADYDKYLKAAYKAAKFPKPRDMIGLDKSLPPDEMKKLMLTNVEVNDQAFRNLADARANAVRGYLAKQVDPGRLFTLAPKLNADGIKNGEKTSRVDLSLE